MIIDTSIIIYGLTILVVLLGLWVFLLERRLKRMMIGKKGSDLEEVISALAKDLSLLEKSKDKIEADLKETEAKVRKSVRGLSTVRFNPFKDSGGNQSFAIAMLNEEGDGVVISSLYARERMSVFAKPVKEHSPEYELTAEEAEALKRAKL